MTAIDSKIVVSGITAGVGVKVSKIAGPFPAVIVGVDQDRWHRWCNGKAYIRIACGACLEEHNYYGQWTAATLRDAIGEVTRHCPETGRRLEFLDGSDVIGAYLRGELVGIDRMPPPTKGQEGR